MNDRKQVFVFSSNLLGVHGKGSALEARLHHNAHLGVGVGRTGDSYAIPTKRRPTMNPNDIMSVDEIRPYVTDFLKYAKDHPELTFSVVAIGCGLAGHKPEEMGPLFKRLTSNVNLPHGWRQLYC